MGQIKKKWQEEKEMRILTAPEDPKPDQCELAHMNFIDSCDRLEKRLDKLIKEQEVLDEPYENWVANQISFGENYR